MPKTEVKEMDPQQEFLQTCIAFLDEVKEMTPCTQVERWLNSTHGADSPTYRNLSRLIKTGVRDGWAANIEVEGPHYRRSRVAEPSAQTHYFSITAVYIDTRDAASDGSFRGQYHLHPYGEFNMVVPMNEGAMLAGPNGWCAAGWTAPAPGSHHYPEVKRGAVIALFFLPAGRISYNIQAPAEPAVSGAAA
jgi:hypothetical protein